MTASGGGELPAIDFGTFILSLSHSAMVHLGEAPDPGGHNGPPNIPMAGQTIELLGLLQQKTQGNLVGEEERILEQVLYDLRSRLAEVKTNR